MNFKYRELFMSIVFRDELNIQRTCLDTLHLRQQNTSPGATSFRRSEIPSNTRSHDLENQTQKGLYDVQ